MSEPESQPNEVLSHITALDGVRGLAIILVLLYHLLWSNDQTKSTLLNLLAQFRNAGWVGVDLFFALSGFLITGILFDSRHDRHFFKNFYARRILRIVPLYYAALLLLALALHRSILNDPRPFLLLLPYLQNTALWYRLPQATFFMDVAGHLWSLAVEEQFYLVWPFLVFFIRSRRALLWLCVLIFVLALLSRLLLLHRGADPNATYKLTFCRADSLIGGAWLALMLRGPARSRVLTLAPAVFFAATTACCVIAWHAHGFRHDTPGPVSQYGYTVLALASSAFIAMAVTPASFTARLLQASPLRFFGRYSYGIYIAHPMLAGLAALTLGPTLKLHIHSRILLHLASFTLILGATIALAWLSFNFFEQPFLRLKRHFNYASTPPGK